MIVRSDEDPIGAGMMAALDAVAKLKASTAPRAIVRIIDCFLVFKDYLAPLHRFKNRRSGTYPANMTKTMMEGLFAPFIFILVRCKTIAKSCGSKRAAGMMIRDFRQARNCDGSERRK